MMGEEFQPLQQRLQGLIFFGFYGIVRPQLLFGKTMGNVIRLSTAGNSSSNGGTSSDGSCTPSSGEYGTISPLRPKPPRTIAITGGKGGVGKSTIALNLAVAYALMEKRVLLVDADFGMGDLNLMLGIEPMRSTLDVLHAAPIDQVLMRAHGITVLPALNGSFALTNMDHRARAYVYSQLETLEPHFDIMIIDGAAGISESAMECVAGASEIVIVSKPCPLSLADSYATMKTLSTRYGVKKAHLAANATDTRTEANEVYTRLSSLATRFLDIELSPMPPVPYDPLVGASIAAGVPLLSRSPDSMAARAIVNLSQAIARQQVGPGDRTVLWKK